MSAENFADRLITAATAKRTHVIVGLDPHLSMLPATFEVEKLKSDTGALADSIARFCGDVIDAVADFAVAVKPQVAFFERLGGAGWNALEAVVYKAKRRDLLVISDAKRGDIGSTAQLYAEYHIGGQNEGGIRTLDADAMTVSPYLGQDSLEPFMRYTSAGKGLFILAKTSNPSAEELQDREIAVASGNVPLYEVVAQVADRLNEGRRGKHGFGPVGLVVGATKPRQAKELRLRHNGLYFLVPGYGAQGATAQDVVDCFDPKGFGAVVNASRSVLFAFRENRYANLGSSQWNTACRLAADRMRGEINEALASVGKLAW